MKIRIALVMALVFAGCAKNDSPIPTMPREIQPQAEARIPSSAEMQEALQKISGYSFGQDNAALIAAEDVVARALKSPQASQEMAALLSTMLSADVSMDVKQFVCRQLALIGNDDTVAVLAPLLLDPKTSDMARYALEPIPGGVADKALIEALGKARDGLKPGIINTLGNRQCKSATGDLKRLTKSSDPVVAECAESALKRVSH